jgi:hypothetical protein
MDDIARVAAALLVKPDESHFGRMHPLTGGISVPISYQQCDRAEAEAAFQMALGRNAAWYLDQIEDAVGHPQEANELVTELTGAPAQSVVQWAAQNAELFR